MDGFEVLAEVFAQQEEKRAVVVGDGAFTAAAAADIWYTRRIPATLEVEYRTDGRTETVALESVVVVPVTDDPSAMGEFPSQRLRIGGRIVDTIGVQIQARPLQAATHATLHFSEAAGTLRPLVRTASGSMMTSEELDEVKVLVQLAVPVTTHEKPAEPDLTPIVAGLERLAQLTTEAANRDPQEIHVHVPEQPAPLIAAAPLVTAVRVVTDRKGNRSYIPVREGEEES